MLKLVLLDCCCSCWISSWILREAYTISLLFCKICIYNIIMQSNKEEKIKKKGRGGKTAVSSVDTPKKKEVINKSFDFEQQQQQFHCRRKCKKKREKERESLY